MGKMERDKGKRGELEVAALMREYGFEARRGQQHRGGSDSPDIIHDIPGVHVEVKFREQFSLYPAIEKAGQEVLDEFPVVFHRRKGKPWVVVMYANDFLGIMGELEVAR
ncbi:hypothetical protein LCGC14_1351320 [marine sediment metagenome]|uniref:Holliday junction resolvase n=1 Tax=marine sediment metagenome TaxID=412755 RepID=A0A0F9ND52_9ZZZZ